MKKNILLFLCVSLILLSTGAGQALQFSSVSWDSFVGQSELIAEARIVKAEYANHSITFTFEIVDAFKGSKVKDISIVHNPRYDGQMGRVGDLCFIAMKKVNGKWAFSYEGRSYWPVTNEQTSNLKTISRVGIDDSLISDIPRLQKKKYQIKTWLLNGSAYVYDANLYLLEDVRNFLKSALK